MISSRRFAALAGTTLLVLSACSGSGGSSGSAAPDGTAATAAGGTGATTDDTAGTGTTGSSPTEPTEPTEPTGSTDETAATSVDGTAGELAASEVLDAVSPSVVYIETDWWSGTGLVLDDGYVLTNAHVVTPFGRADVSPPGEAAIEDVPVVGIDFAADLAVLGPIDVDLPPTPIGSIDGLRGGESVYLIGYPGEHEDEPTPTISEGIVSKLRTADDGQAYVQTDADISGGQSGGALADASGRVIAISGMSFDEAFALALSLDSALERVPAILAGGDGWTAYPTDGVTEGTITVDGSFVGGHVDVLAVDDGPARDVSIGFDPTVLDDVAVLVELDDGTSFISRTALPLVAAQLGVDADTMEEQVPPEMLIEADLAGTYSFELPAGQTAAVSLYRVSVDEPFDVTITSSEPMAVLGDPDDGTPIAVGDAVDGIIEPIEYQDIYLLELAEGDEIELTATSTLGDTSITVLAPGESPNTTTFFVDDDDLGFLGLDATGTYTASATGTYRVVVGDAYGQCAYHLTIERA